VDLDTLPVEEMEEQADVEKDDISGDEKPEPEIEENAKDSENWQENEESWEGVDDWEGWEEGQDDWAKEDWKEPEKKRPMDVVPKWMKTAVTLDEAEQQPIEVFSFFRTLKTRPRHLTLTLTRLQECGFLEPLLKANLTKMGVENLFAVQAKVIPMTLSFAHRDICVAAPTGSGKTLSYAIPIVQALMRRVIPRVRALILLPSRDLVVQVKGVFDSLVLDTDLNVQMTLGQTAMSEEAQRLVNPWARSGRTAPPLGGACAADIVVATPGRLLDHVAGTPGFTLQHIEYLVIDETDRLLKQSYNDWVSKVIKAVHSSVRGDTTSVHGRPSFDATTLRGTPGSVTSQSPIRKLLFSATLTKDPEKLLSLHLRHPILFTANEDGRYKTPDTLLEFLVVCDPAQKPVVLMHLIEHLQRVPTIAFTNSVEATHRLHLLLHLFGGISVAEFSSTLTQAQRTSMLTEFREGRIQLLICSDAMTRGIDIDGVMAVINYDAPTRAKTYVHRSGRTARAGKSGRVFTLVTAEDHKPFKGMLRKCDNNFVRPFYIPPKQLEELLPRYEDCLEDLKKHVQSEEGLGKRTEDGETEDITQELHRSVTRQIQRNALRPKV